MYYFFINRPIFAWVMTFLIMLSGLLSLQKIPITQYPNLAPPAISISAYYPGASAQTIEDSITSILEQQLNSLDNLLYINSSSDTSGAATITVFFEPGTNTDIAQVQVQNKIQLAQSLLPQEVQLQGVTVKKAAKNYVMIFTLSSTDAQLRDIDLGGYAQAHIIDSISRINGVGQVDLFSDQYAMRIWLQTDKLTLYHLMPKDIIAAVKAQNTQVTPGQLGSLPAVSGQQLNVQITAQCQLSSVEQFEAIIIKVNPDGSSLYLRDVARVEVGAAGYSRQSRINGKSAAAIGVKLTPEANAITVAQEVRETLNQLADSFPSGMKIDYPLDTSTFIKLSVHEVLITLLEAGLLVFLVMYLFLQNARATLIPIIVVPAALLGTCSIIWLFGFSINVLTMFGMVLAIGLLVDDAIVIVENVERLIIEENLNPKEATKKAMDQVQGALIGITLVLTCVFIPMAFFPGSVGAIYRQFSISIISSMLFSLFLAFSLTPALCANLLKPRDSNLKPSRFFIKFNQIFESNRILYRSRLIKILNQVGRYLLLYIGLIAVALFLYTKLPTSFLPEEDQGYLINIIQLPIGATAEQTLKVVKEVENYYIKVEHEAVDQIIVLMGFSYNGSGQNTAMAYVKLKDWQSRKKPALQVQSIVMRAALALSNVKEAIIVPLNPPAISELGNTSGFNLILQDKSGLGRDQLTAARNDLLAMSFQDLHVANVRPQGMEKSFQYQINIDQQKAQAMGLSLSDINDTLSSLLGSSYINQFIYQSRIQKVILQADAIFRMLPEDIERIHVRNKEGLMVPFSAFCSTKWVKAPSKLERYNGLASLEIVGNAAQGRSSGEAMIAMEKIIQKLPYKIGFSWTGSSYEERLANSQALVLFSLSILIVFLCLAALYESWSIPIAVLLIIPLGVLGALVAALMRSLPNDVYFKVGLLTTIGLATKNAILIIEFAKDLQSQGKTVKEAAIEAAYLRLRPILMTSFAFILGVLPLVFSQGAGSTSQNAVGTGVAGGMIFATVIGIFLVPLLFVCVRNQFSSQKCANNLKKGSDTSNHNELTTKYDHEKDLL
jgi:multidrug efflux pump